MAYEGAQQRISLLAGEALTAKQYHAVALGAAGTVVAVTATTDIPIGILQNAPASGSEAVVCIAGVTKVAADVALAWADVIGNSDDGKALPLVAGAGDAPTTYTYGQVIKAAAAEGGYATAVVACPGQRGK